MARIFLDCETTGLNPTTGHLLEVAVVAVDTTAPAYTEVAAQSWVIRPAAQDWRDCLETPVLQMHAASGLLADVAARGGTLAEAEAGLLRFLAFFGNPAPGRDPIGGFSPHFDLGWLAAHLPRVRAYFSHRCYDCSTLRQLARDLGHDPTDLTPTDLTPTDHRALADCRSAIATARAVAGLLTR